MRKRRITRAVNILSDLYKYDSFNYLKLMLKTCHCSTCRSTLLLDFSQIMKATFYFRKKGTQT